ncbi:MAG TPA: lipase family protein [Candidatus Omnitrophota bacterium]|nr:lipase family protein [Candidatus Omnitrophota bacterium]HPD84238.1 lipase family protein [Candidatus Omnitrophota bacterium]HRZ03094.1 lipase family protein [Candidatus Omnitrophota bacterium]
MSKLEFISSASDFNLTDAFYLSKISELVYEDLDKIEDVLKEEYGLSKYKPFEVKETDTQAFLASNEDILVLAFRGTTSWADWMTNFKIVMVSSSVGKVHSGFARSLNSIWDDVNDSILSGKDRNQTLWVAGHSLGGALATLAVDRLTEENSEIVDGLYTFGQPRVGDKQFADNFDRKMKRHAFRLVDDEDIVTKIPIPPGYRHIGTEYFINNKGLLSKNNNFWEWFRSCSESVAIRSSDDANKYRAQNPGGIRDHGASYYSKYLYQNLQKKRKSPFLSYINGA